ncbi:MAG: hypothetical protein LH609_20415 [Rudanella sp.]|nr:hypothetical protein [Rudanella sp.]
MLKLELFHNVQMEPFDGETSPESVSDFLDSILALEAMQKEPWEVSLYDLIGRPPFQEESELTNHEVTHALDTILQLMAGQEIALAIRSPDDYDDRTIYRFVTNELFQYQLGDLGESCPTMFIYEEFYPNNRYDIVKQGKRFIKGLISGTFDRYNTCLGDQFLDRQTIPVYAVSVQDEVIDTMNRLTENLWPRTVRAGFLKNVSIADDAETAQATMVLHLGVDGDPQYITKEGTVHLVRYDFWWFINRVMIDDWVLS